MPDRIINKNPVLVLQDTVISDVVGLMIEKQISSVLVQDDKDFLTGIVTERDIVRKFTLLDMGDKLTKCVGTIMSRPLAFVQETNLEAGIMELYQERKLRHFPVLCGREPLVPNLVGIVSVTDFLNFQLRKNTAETGPDSGPEKTCQAGIICHSAEAAMEPANRLQSLNISLKYIADFNEFIRQHSPDKIPVIFDMDSFTQKALKELVPLVKSYRAPLVMLTSNPTLANAFKAFVNPQTQKMLLKPMDYEFIAWLFLEKKW